MSFRAGDSLTPEKRLSAELLQLHDVRAGRGVGPVQARPGLIVDDRRIDHSEAVELRPHRATIGAEHADLDIVADPNVAGQLERAGHAIEVVAGWAVEAELHRAGVR